MAKTSSSPPMVATRLFLLYFVPFATALFLLAAAKSSFGSSPGKSVVLPSHHPPAVAAELQATSCHNEHSCAAAKNLTIFKGQLAQVFSTKFRPFDFHPQADWDLFKPIVSCPPERPLTRYGGDGDGGKLLCTVAQPSNIISSSGRANGGCLIYSLGSFGDFKFETEMLAKTACEIHTFDCTYDGSSIHPGRHHYHKWCLGDPALGGRYRTWANITSALGHQQVYLLKMDIEGHEFAVLSSFRAEDTLPKELSVEMHMISYESKHTYRPKSPAELAFVFYHMANVGYAAYAQERNDACPFCCEFTFMRV